VIGSLALVRNSYAAWRLGVCSKRASVTGTKSATANIPLRWALAEVRLNRPSTPTFDSGNGAKASGADRGRSNVDWH